MKHIVGGFLAFVVGLFILQYAFATPGDQILAAAVGGFLTFYGPMYVGQRTR